MSRYTPRALLRARVFTRERALHALHLMRTSGRSLRAAAAESHTTPLTVLKYVGASVDRGASGRYRAAASDRLTRRLQFLTPAGKIAITVRGSRGASHVAAYWAAVDRYLKTGDTEQLQPFRGASLRVGKTTYPFVTDPRILERLGHAGEVSFEDLYVNAT